MKKIHEYYCSITRGTKSKAPINYKTSAIVAGTEKYFLQRTIWTLQQLIHFST